MTTIRIITLIVALASLGMAIWTYYRVLGKYERLQEDYQGKTKELVDKNKMCLSLLRELCSNAVWEGHEDILTHCFVVKSGKKIVKRFYYDINDPDDREYMRIEAQELVEHLNHEP